MAYLDELFKYLESFLWINVLNYVICTPIFSIILGFYLFKI